MWIFSPESLNSVLSTLVCLLLRQVLCCLRCLIDKLEYFLDSVCFSTVVNLLIFAFMFCWIVDLPGLVAVLEKSD